MTTRPGADRPLCEELRDYYGPLLPYLERSLTDRGDRPLWRSLGRLHRGGRFLDVGAGTGRVTRWLAPYSRFTVALDLNPDALRRARRWIGEAPRVHPLVADMRDFTLATRFDLVVAGNDPFSHLRSGRSRDRALRRIAEHLVPSGRFVLDALWLSPARLEEASEPGGREMERTIREPGDAPPLHVRSRWRCDPETRVCRIAWVVREEGRDPVRARFRGRCWTRDEVDERFGRAGLAVHRVWGGYHREPWSQEAEQLVVVGGPAP
ncbi:MAG: class I SAM-dependent methyltransferase [Gemmatimonadota bacterium]